MEFEEDSSTPSGKYLPASRPGKLRCPSMSFESASRSHRHKCIANTRLIYVRRHRFSRKDLSYVSSDLSQSQKESSLLFFTWKNYFENRALLLSVLVCNCEFTPLQHLCERADACGSCRQVLGINYPNKYRHNICVRARVLPIIFDTRGKEVRLVCSCSCSNKKSTFHESLPGSYLDP